MGGRAVELRLGASTLDLTAAPYTLMAMNGADGSLEIEVRVDATSAPEVDGYVARLRQWVRAGIVYASTQAGQPLYVYAKRCDDLSVTAELGATWRRVQVTGGGVAVTGTQPPYTVATVRLVLDVDSPWRRAAVECALEAAAAADVTVRTDGGLTVADTKYLTARRISWTAAGGVTVRVRWVFADSNITFVQFSADYEARALYLASDNKVYMYDNAGGVASSAALTAAAGDEVDLVFKWDPVTPAMKLWVNGVVGSTTASQCEIGFSTTGSDLVVQGGFEAGGTGGNFNGGTEVDDGTSDTLTGWTSELVNDVLGDKVEASATKYAGSYAVKITQKVLPLRIYQEIAVTAGKSYRLAFYVRGDGSVGGKYGVYDVTNSASIFPDTATGITGTSFAEYTDGFMAPAGCALVRIGLATTGVGAAYFDAVTLYEVDAAGNVDTYRLANPTGGAAQSVLGIQVWATPLTDAQCAGLSAWGRPEAELLVVTPPTDTKNTNGKYLLANVPGEVDARLRLILDGTSQDYAQLKIGLRPLSAAATLAWECESGTNGANTLDAADANASGGNVAQFTPADAVSATRVTVVLAADPDDVAALRGQYRLYLQLKDNAGTANYNLIKWRLVVAGQAEDYSEEFAAAAVGTYSLVDLGLLEIPPGTWPAESLAATTDVHAGSYITLEIAVRNTASSGTLDLDAVYLAPAELEGTWLGTFDVSAWYELLDWTGERPCAIGVADPRSLEFAAWAAYTGDILELPAVAGDAGTLWVRWLRSAAEQCYAADVCDVWVFVEPRWI